MLEPLPAALRERHGFAGAADARVAIHFPRDEADVREARRRLAYEELFLHQAALLIRRGERRSELAARPLDPQGELVTDWIEGLPFEPTEDQRAACREVDADLRGGAPDAAAADGRGWQRQDRRRPYAMLRAVENGRSGRADGADGDAGRAALR